MTVELNTEWLIKRFSEKYDLSIGGEILNSQNLTILNDDTQFERIPNKYGCYFIFSNLKKEQVFTFSNYDCFDNKIVKGGVDFHCIYNGKTKNIKSRIKNHLKNAKTKDEILIGNVSKIPQTGCLSLEDISAEEIVKLVSQNKLITEPNYSYLKHSKNLSKLNQRKVGKTSYLLNGINIFESKWTGNSFGIIVLTTESKIGAGIIEQSFRDVNGMPPLCKM